jgi:hypothetical protein
MDEHRSAREGPRPPFRSNHDAGTRVAGQLALTRQRGELRRERDLLLVRLAAELGAAGMAGVLGLQERCADGLLRSAHERLGLAHAEPVARPASEIRVRRLRSAETARLSAGAPMRAPGPEPRHPVEGRDGGSRVSRSPVSRADRGSGGRAAVAGDRWALADAHYEALGRVAFDGGEEQLS